MEETRAVRHFFWEAWMIFADDVRKVLEYFSEKHNKGGAWWPFFVWRIQRIMAFTDILFGFPPVSHSKKEMHEAKWKYFMTVCNQPFVEGSLRLKNGSTGLSIGKIMKILDISGQPRIRREKILSNMQRLCIPVEKTKLRHWKKLFLHQNFT